MSLYRLSAAAQADIIEILTRTQERFGEAARLRYEALIVAAIRDIAENPSRPGAPERPELGVDARTWHLRHSREKARTGTGTVRRPRHFIVFRTHASGMVEIGRILHDAMELERHRLTTHDWN
ncbi:plasmid stabilization protein ParE [Sphingobium jiangsuense]|uniref:Toxin ParE1/3/4 n=1 Tax=Sphingobium jiangsuense TaxID=870476 RepID=A0A7W6BJU0_9SPHN|nr:type II toxin-antitoxin system RelE/ParE family toxin [Sphingobium jiangsuense]MBB3926361.1 toxin ParE1/3/4 [Sphingobium jiangsuense]QEH80866.1 type II toxin-antitoxin system RelE/ParE family toxin [Sphingomonas sp. C8-2]GLS99742.1 plasmid stabilization protein ParE [Sphingobium jiangsuense]